jgi:hypothetical protein
MIISYHTSSSCKQESCTLCEDAGDQAETTGPASPPPPAAAAAAAAGKEAVLFLTKHISYQDPYGPKEPLIFGGM